MRSAKHSTTIAPAMPVWDHRPETAIAHLDALEAFLTNGQIQRWREAGMSDASIAVEARTLEAQHRAIFDQLRAETRMRLGLDA